MSDSTPTSRAGALAGIRVLDLSRILAGPFCSMILADYGADVIKVERPGVGDGSRQWGPPWAGGESAYFLGVNRNKRSVTLDLGRPAGQEIARRLAAKSDVLLENFLPTTAERMGLGYDRLAEESPGLVYCSITGYGHTGPQSHLPGYDFVIQAESGLMSITGPSDGEPHKVGVAVSDLSTGLFAATAILAALHSRSRDGRGQHIDVSLLDSQIACLANVAQSHLVTGEPPVRHGNAHPSIVPYESFATADGQIALAVGNDGQFERLCRLADRLDLAADERYRTNAGRVTHRDQLIAELRRVFATRPTAEWLEALHTERIPAGEVRDVPAALADPQLRARDMVRTVTHPTAGPLETVGPVAKLSHTPAEVRTAPPLLGADTRDVLVEVLGCSDEEVAQLEREGAVGTDNGRA